MTKLLIRDLEKELVRAKKFDFDVGDVVDVHCMIREGDKERVQIFSGTVIARKRGDSSIIGCRRCLLNSSPISTVGCTTSIGAGARSKT